MNVFECCVTFDWRSPIFRRPSIFLGSTALYLHDNHLSLHCTFCVTRKSTCSHRCKHEKTCQNHLEFNITAEQKNILRTTLSNTVLELFRRMESQGNSPLQDEDVRLLQEITIPDGAIGLLQWRNDMVTYLTVDHIVSSVYCCDLVLPNSQRCIAASQPDGSPGKGPPILHGSSKAIHTPNSNYCCNFVQDNGEQ